MLQEVGIENFRLLRSVKVPLRPLTVLIGKNDSGKSAFLAALQQFINWTGFHPWDHWRHDTKTPIVIGLALPEGAAQMMVPGPGGGAPAVVNQPLLQAVRPLAFFHLPAQGVQMTSNGTSDEEGPPVISSNGDGVPALFDYLLRRDRERFNQALAALRRLVPGLADVEIRTPNPHLRRLDLVIEGGLRSPAVSPGSGRVSPVASSVQAPPVSTVCHLFGFAGCGPGGPLSLHTTSSPGA
jgi:hypothetical protein